MRSLSTQKVIYRRLQSLAVVLAMSISVFACSTAAIEVPVTGPDWKGWRADLVAIAKLSPLTARELQEQYKCGKWVLLETQTTFFGEHDSAPLCVGNAGDLPDGIETVIVFATKKSVSSLEHFYSTPNSYQAIYPVHRDRSPSAGSDFLMLRRPGVLSNELAHKSYTPIVGMYYLHGEYWGLYDLSEIRKFLTNTNWDKTHSQRGH